MPWKRMLAVVTGEIEESLLARVEYLIEENRVLRNQLDKRLKLTDPERKVLAEKARTNKITIQEMEGGTFTITNHGVSGSLFAMPIINQPQSAILGVGKLQKRVVVLADETGYDTIAVRPMAYLTLTFDHRILDGAIADAFLSKVVTTLENWT